LPPRIIENDAPAFATDEFGAEKLLEFPDLAAEEALLRGVALGGPGHAASLGNEAKALEPVERKATLP